MNQPILTRDDGNALYSFEGKHVVPLDNENGNYREWLIGVNHTQYCIICEDDTWTLLYYVPDINEWCDASDDVDAFLRTHRLILAA